ncbi:MAG: hypothetical protein ACI4SB_10565, partial [Acutalibacteraceae bacterium]
MKKFLRTGKKTLAVFMAVMMVMTAWVFFEPTKASAATAGKYKIAFCVYDNDNGANGVSSLEIKYKTRANNATSTTDSAEKSVTVNTSTAADHLINGDDYYIVQVDNEDFPSYVYAYGAVGNWVYPEWRIKVMVAKAGTADYYQGSTSTAWKEITDFEFFHKNFLGSGSGSASKSISDFSNLPAVTSMSFISGSTSITIPKTGASNGSYTYVAGVYDQYGVLMTYDPTYYVRTSAPTSAQSSSNTITGVSITTAGVMTVTSSAQMTTADTKTIYVHATYGTLYANRTVTLTDPTYTFKFTNTHGG